MKTAKELALMAARALSDSGASVISDSVSITSRKRRKPERPFCIISTSSTRIWIGLIKIPI